MEQITEIENPSENLQKVGRTFCSKSEWIENNPLIVYRRNKDIKQSELARLLDASPQKLVHWEKGNCLPKIDAMLQITAVTGIYFQQMKEWYDHRQDFA